MEPSDLLRFVVSVLERLSLRYFVTGSTPRYFYGEPRFTNGVLRTTGDEVDTAYIDRWAATLGVTEVWRAILDRLREP